MIVLLLFKFDVLGVLNDSYSLISMDETSASYLLLLPLSILV